MLPQSGRAAKPGDLAPRPRHGARRVRDRRLRSIASNARARRYLELPTGNCEMARIYRARSKALGSGQFFWLRLPLS